MRYRATVTAVLMLIGAPLGAGAEVVRDIEFPVGGPASYTDTFNDERDGGARPHEGIDIFADKMTPAVAAVDGRVRWLTETEQSYGWMLTLEDDEGWQYWYIHLNNDNIGTDDGQGGYDLAFAPGIRRGSVVKRGDHVAYVGDSGNAEHTPPHLHFEIHDPGGFAVNPFYTLRAAKRGGAFDPEAARTAASSISVEKALRHDPSRAYFCVPDSLIRSVSHSAVYYCGEDGKRYVFPNTRVYFSWYDDFDDVQTISDVELAQVPLGGNATFRPGTSLVKIVTDPKVYAVDAGGALRWVSTPEIAEELYGSDWADQVQDIDDALFVDYFIGEPVTSAG